MTPNPYDIVREACVKANPDILKMQTGIKVLMTDASVFGERRSGIVTLLGNSSTPENKNPSGIFDILGVCPDEKTTYSARWDEVEPYTILGRDIRLADVLLAIKGKYMIGTLQKDEEFKNGTEWFGEIAWDWNLRHDSLEWHRDNQLETVEWLAELLTNN